MKRYTLLLLVLAGIFYSACQNKDYVKNITNIPQPTPDIALSQESIYVDCEANTCAVSVTAICSWVAESNCEWLVVDTESGDAGKEELQFTVTQNDEEKERAAEIKVSGSEANTFVKLVVIQKVAAPQIEVADISSLEFGYEGGSQTVTVAANFDYDVKSSADWVTCKKETAGVKVTLSANSECKKRETEVKIYSERYDLDDIVISIVQGEFVPEFEVADISSLEFGYEAGSQTVAVAANFDYDVSMSADWVSCEKVKNGAKITLLANNECKSRCAEVKIYSKKYNKKGVTIAITQAEFAPEFEISEVQPLHFGYEGGSQIVPLKSNFDYDVEPTVDWITFERVADGAKIIAAANKVCESRAAEVRIYSKKYGREGVVVALTQDKFVPEFEISEVAPLHYNYKGGSQTLSLKSNFDYDVEPTVDWISFERVSGGAKIISAANSTYESRSAEVRIYSQAYDKEGIIVSVTQDACECHIGDVMTINKTEGVVYYIGNNKISLVALKQSKDLLKWSTEYVETSANDWYNGANNMAVIKKRSSWTSRYPAFKWCSDCGTGWYLPAYYEVQELYNQKALVDEFLQARGLNPLGEWIWSSTECNNCYSYLQHFTNGDWRYFFKDDTNEVRAIYSY